VGKRGEINRAGFRSFEGHSAQVKKMITEGSIKLRKGTLEDSKTGNPNKDRDSRRKLYD